jgi:hypothetical protein
MSTAMRRFCVMFIVCAHAVGAELAPPEGPGPTKVGPYARWSAVMITSIILIPMNGTTMPPAP